MVVAAKIEVHGQEVSVQITCETTDEAMKTADGIAAQLKMGGVTDISIEVNSGASDDA
jgi:hypothetical protein